ncbi:MAG TPA: DUF4251 domain-containing protein [Flavisolibacter sp.]|nr:DUF4251 domain-containing protein [Flavisolibacter sp.]
MLLSTFFILKPSFAQEPKEATLEKAIQSRHFIFKAQSAYPMRGGMRQLTSEYDLKVNGDTLTAYLPYFGRAYVAPIDPTRGGIQFTDVQSDYTLKAKKKSSEITIVPKNAPEARQLFLTISANGNATLQVTSNNRDPISFHGYVEAIKEKN